jgi:hypothetical protein
MLNQMSKGHRIVPLPDSIALLPITMKTIFCVAAALSIFAAFAPQLRAQQHSADCWLENNSSYRFQTNFRGTQPSLSDLHSYMQSLATQYTIPIEILAGIVFQESQVMQYDAAPGAQGFLIHNLNECLHFAAACREDVA